MPDFFANPTYFELFVGSFLIALSGAISPGPLLVRTIANTPRYGRFTGTVMMLGHGILELSLVAGIILGLGKILTLPSVFISIAFLGGLALIWMAFSTLRNLSSCSLALAAEGQSPDISESRLVLDGILTSAVNPYWCVWWATIGLSFLAVAQGLGFQGVAVFYCGHILGDLAWYTLISVLMIWGVRRINDRVYRGLMGFCGVMLGLFGCLFLVDSLRRAIEFL